MGTYMSHDPPRRLDEPFVLILAANMARELCAEW